MHGLLGPIIKLVVQQMLVLYALDCGTTVPQWIRVRLWATHLVHPYVVLAMQVSMITASHFRAHQLPLYMLLH